MHHRAARAAADCASLAGAAALMHFRRPDVTVAGEVPVFHPPDERAPVPLTLHTIVRAPSPKYDIITIIIIIVVSQLR